VNMLRAHSIIPASTSDALGLLTFVETVRALRCSRSKLHRILSGRVAGLPPLPVFYLGRRGYVRQEQLHAWICSLEDRERERMYASGCFGVWDDDLEHIAGA
jgi:hypothetical protein